MLKNRNFVLLWIAQCISSAGDSFTFLALTIKVNDFYTDAGESARALGLILIAFALPQLVVGLFAGTMVDRWDRKRVMIASDVIRALVIPAFILIRTPADLPMAFAIAFLASTFSVFFYPARTALLPALVPEEELMTANGWMQMGNTIARLSGPVLAGIVVSQWGSNIAFGIDAISFIISAMLLLGIMGVVTRVAGDEDSGRSAWNDLKEGVRYATRSKLLQGVTLGIAIAMLGLGAVNVLFIPFLRHVFQAPIEALGGLEASQGAGMFLGGLIIGAVGKRMRPILVAVIAMLILGLSILSFGFAPAYSYAFILLPLAGFTLPPINASLQTMLQRGVPSAILGRAGSVMDMAISVANLFSMGVAGWMGDLIGLRETFILSGVMLMLGGLAMGWILRKEQTSPEADADLALPELQSAGERSVATE
jgi:DHA3 family macrolide efflux protein-like MFS transporter